jgi:serine phosphatase RsbU (regulator of sigma subunit)
MNKWMQNIESLSRNSLVTVSVVLLIGVGVIDYFTGVEVSFSILYLLPVALLAWYVSRGAGVAMAIICAIVWYMADLLSSPSHSTPIVPYWNATVMLGIFLITALSLSTLKQTKDRDEKLARDIQERLLPTEMPRISRYEIVGAWQPAQSVSGDYYDVIRPDDDSLVLCIGDVAGHGIPAALLMSNLQAAVRMLALSKPTPQDMCTQLNKFILSNTTADKFITFFYAVLDVNKNELVYTNAGHNRPLIVRESGAIVSLAKGGFPLGLRPNSHYDQGIAHLEEGDLLLIFTDGVIETHNTKKEEFGEDRFLDVLLKHHRSGARATCTGILNAVSEFSKATYQDDLTLLALSVHATDSV